MIGYQAGNALDLDQVIELYRTSTLGERRPVDDRDRMGKMLANANLVITAWETTPIGSDAGGHRPIGHRLLLRHLSRRSCGSRLVSAARDRP